MRGADTALAGAVGDRPGLSMVGLYGGLGDTPTTSMGGTPGVVGPAVGGIRIVGANLLAHKGKPGQPAFASSVYWSHCVETTALAGWPLVVGWLRGVTVGGRPVYSGIFLFLGLSGGVVCE